MLPRIHLLLILTLCVFAAVRAWAGAPVVHIVITQRIPVVDRLVADVQRAIGNRADVRIIDLKGKINGADAAVSDLASTIGPDDVVLTLGAPAAQAVVRRMPGRPVVCAMTMAPTSGKTTKDTQVYYTDGDPSVDSLVKALGSVWKNLGRVAVIGGSEVATTSPHVVGKTQVIWQPIGANADLIEVLDRLAGDVDGFVFPRDSAVLNRRTIDAVVEWLGKKGKPAIGYSRFLVTAGFPAAVGIDDAGARRKVVALLGALVEGTAPPADGSNGAVWLNRKFLESFGIDPMRLEVAAQLL